MDPPIKLHMEPGRYVVSEGGVLVTSPARTVADLARVGDADHRTALDGFARDPATIRAGIDWLEHAGTVPAGACDEMRRGRVDL